jgi:uncharacterized protein YkwD
MTTAKKVLFLLSIILLCVSTYAALDAKQQLEIDNIKQNKVSLLKEENKHTCGIKYDTKFVEAINEYRKQNNITPLVLNCLISKASQNHSEWMSNMGIKYPLWHDEADSLSKVFSHKEVNNEYWSAEGFTGQYPWDRCDYAGLHCTGENIAWREDPNITYYMNQFKDSPSHNAMMLNKDMKFIGVGYKEGFLTTNFRESELTVQDTVVISNQLQDSYRFTINSLFAFISFIVLIWITI